MQRRDLVKSVILGMTAASVMPVAGNAADASANENVIFTESQPGHWAKAAPAHIPQTSVASGKVTVKTPHPMSEEHYIVSHSVVLGNGTFVSRKTFSHKDEPVSEHPLPSDYKGKVTIISTCNQHDTWVKTISV